MSERISKSGLCDTCVAACCRSGTDMALSHEEQGFMMEAGTGLGVILPAGIPRVQEVDWGARARNELAERSDLNEEQKRRLDRVSRVPKNHGLYVLETDCGHLDGNKLCL